MLPVRRPREWSPVQLFLGYVLASLICGAWGWGYLYFAQNNHAVGTRLGLALAVLGAVLTCQLAWFWMEHRRPRQKVEEPAFRVAF